MLNIENSLDRVDNYVYLKNSACFNGTMQETEADTYELTQNKN